MAMMLTDDKYYKAIADSIRNKNGGTASYLPSEMSPAIDALSAGGIDTSNADATAADILEGKTAYVDGVRLEGTYVPLNTSNATATAEQILNGQTAYVDGAMVTGTMTNKPNITISQTGYQQGGQVNIPKGYQDDTIIAIQDAKVIESSAKWSLSDDGKVSLSPTTIPTGAYYVTSNGSTNSLTLGTQLPTLSGGTFTQNETIATKGKFLTSDIVINVPYVNYRTGNGAPSNSLGNDGDFYIDLGE